MQTTDLLAGLGEDAADILSDNHPYLRLALRRDRTARLTPGGLPQPPELAGVDADARVPNVLQPMSGEFAGGEEVDGGQPAFFNPSMPAPTGLASREIMPPGILQAAHPDLSGLGPGTAVRPARRPQRH